MLHADMSAQAKRLPSAVVFDFDGTIADTFNDAVKLYNRLAPVYGYKPVKPEDLPSARNLTMKQFIREYDIPRMKIPSMVREGRRIFGKRIGEIQPIVGMPELLRELRPHVETLGILTSNAKANVKAFLQKEDLAFFDFISTTSKLSGKAKNLRAILKTFTLEPDELIYIGDECRDLKAAGKAEVRSVGVTWGFNLRKVLEKQKPDQVVDQPLELLAWLRDEKA
ncbi:HAD hydrolase-like protein [Cerasicoccus frondis]|uniref:HAD hydrolase-like protein n=1 Tax=Cerasicoccus frondis TaxID=490090 RepID=UPI0028527BC1|nr:HAD hydrolase-like protein [Cerasicoccus frondis]